MMNDAKLEEFKRSQVNRNHGGEALKVQEGVLKAAGRWLSSGTGRASCRYPRKFPDPRLAPSSSPPRPLRLSFTDNFPVGEYSGFFSNDSAVWFLVNSRSEGAALRGGRCGSPEGLSSRSEVVDVGSTGCSRFFYAELGQ